MFEPRSGEFEFNFFVLSKYKLAYLLLDEWNLSKKSIYHNFQKDRVSRLSELNSNPTPISHSPYTTGNTFLSPRSTDHVYLSQ